MDGRTSVTSRALERTVTAIAAGHLGVPGREVTVTLADSGGSLALAVTGPIRITSLRTAGSRTGIPTLIRHARSAIRDDATKILGREIGMVSVTVSGASIERNERRVK